MPPRVYLPGGRPPRGSATACSSRRSPRPCGASRARAATASTRARSPPTSCAGSTTLGGLHTMEDFAAQRSRLGRADLDALSRPRGLRMPAERAGAGGADDPAHARGLSTSRRALRARPTASICSPRRPRPPIACATPSSAIRARSRVAGRAASSPTRYAERVARRTIRLDRACRAGAWDERRAQGHDLSLRRRSRRQRDLVHQLAVPDFGSGIMAPESGVLLHNRGISFRTDPGPSQRDRAGQAAAAHDHPGHAGEGRPRGDAVRRHGRPLPGGRPCASPASRMLDRGLDPQQAAEAPRSFAFEGVLQVETHHSASRSPPISRAAATTSIGR